MIATGILCLLALLLTRLETGAAWSPDSVFYARRWKDAPRPYKARVLLPTLMGWCRGDPLLWWQVLSYGSICLTAVALGQLGGWVAAALFLGLASTRTNLAFPILTDSFGLLLTVLLTLTPMPWAIPLALVVGACNEKGPIIAAVVTGNPWCLYGLLPWLVSYILARKPSADRGDPEWLVDPRKGIWSQNSWASFFDARAMLLPWGVAMIALPQMSPLLLLVGYGFCVFATDRARVYQWIGPWVCLEAAHILAPHPHLAVVLVLLNFLNPWRRIL